MVYDNLEDRLVGDIKKEFEEEKLYTLKHSFHFSVIHKSIECTSNRLKFSAKIFYLEREIKKVNCHFELFAMSGIISINVKRAVISSVTDHPLVPKKNVFDDEEEVFEYLEIIFRRFQYDSTRRCDIVGRTFYIGLPKTITIWARRRVNTFCTFITYEDSDGFVLMNKEYKPFVAFYSDGDCFTKAPKEHPIWKRAILSSQLQK